MCKKSTLQKYENYSLFIEVTEMIDNLTISF